MLPGADLGSISNSLVQPVSNVDPTPGLLAAADMRLQGLNRIEQFAIGQQIQAKVVSLFQDGSALVKMGETAARMVLPANARAGSSVLLTLTSKDPRPTFSMQVESDLDENAPLETTARQPVGYNASGSATASSLAQTDIGITGPGARGAGVAAAAANTNVAPAAANAAANGPALPQSVNITLSTVGRMINNLMQSQPEGMPATIISRTPMLAGPPVSLPVSVDAAAIATHPLLASTAVSTPQIASALRESIAFSGVFYESHVTEWVDGKRGLADLQREPQSQIAKASDNTSLLTRPEAASSEIGKIVNAQLNTLDQHRISWQGEVWPGQYMEWDISRENSDQEASQQNNNGQETPPVWQSVVRFNFEHLGSVAASIRLIGDQIHMQIRTNNENTTESLRLHGSELVDSMAAAGSSLDSLIVKRDGPTA